MISRRCGSPSGIFVAEVTADKELVSARTLACAGSSWPAVSQISFVMLRCSNLVGSSYRQQLGWIIMLGELIFTVRHNHAGLTNGGLDSIKHARIVR